MEPSQDYYLVIDIEEFRFLISEIFWFRLYKINYYQLSITNTEKILELIETKYPKTITNKS